MNVALYFSNWTQMDIQFQKLILLAMKMNNSNTLNMKLTEKLIINLELFKSVRINSMNLVLQNNVILFFFNNVYIYIKCNLYSFNSNSKSKVKSRLYIKKMIRNRY